MTSSRIVFLTREPLIHQLGGSTTYALNLLEVLAEHGAQVTVVTTNASSCSPLLWFRPVAKLPRGVRFAAPGFTRLGAFYITPFSLTAWARAISRLGARSLLLKPLSSLMGKLFRKRLFTNAWDLTPPAAAESRVALEQIEKRGATTVIANYAFWGELLRDPALADRKRIILMHDLLSARVKLFLQSGIPLDSPPIEEDEELHWLDGANCVLAAQQREADIIRPQIKANVIVQPMVYKPRRLATEPEPDRCLFVGSNIIPNQTGLRWFLYEVWPQVLAKNPAAKLAVAGSICSWLEDGIPGVIKMNSVPSIEQEYARATVCVVPLLIGSGIKIKLIEALSFGKAVVATSIGVQGLEQWAEGVVDVHDDATGFAEATLSLLTDTAKRAAREEEALQFIREHYSAEALLSTHFKDCVL